MLIIFLLMLLLDETTKLDRKGVRTPVSRVIERARAVLFVNFILFFTENDHFRMDMTSIELSILRGWTAIQGGGKRVSGRWEKK